MMIATKKIADSVILATLLALLALPQCSWAQNATDQAPETNIEVLPMSSEAIDVVYEALVAESGQRGE